MSIDYKYVEEFKNVIKKGEFKENLKGELNNNTTLSVYYNAIYSGYLDACRTFTNNKLEKNADKRITKLSEEIMSYLNNKDKQFELEKYCKILIDDQKMTFGQAQKIVNMAFKYLYCLINFDNEIDKEYYLNKFKPCHMPLDRIMLEWLRRNSESVEKKSVGAWSKITDGAEDVDKDGKYTYGFYQKVIKTISEKENRTPLELDFLNWKEMSLILAAEDFLKSISEEKVDVNSSKQELFERIRQILNKEKGEEKYETRLCNGNV
ncbi:MAG: hypothetical protein IJA34_07620 [Lachnospiraceae bacterium]|nr:hypothetical protein [Lachnospiraceae bacterium]